MKEEIKFELNEYDTYSETVGEFNEKIFGIVKKYSESGSNFTKMILSTRLLNLISNMPSFSKKINLQSDQADDETMLVGKISNEESIIDVYLSMDINKNKIQ